MTTDREIREKIKMLSHSQFLVYYQQKKRGSSSREALEYALNNNINVGDYIYRNYHHIRQ